MWSVRCLVLIAKVSRACEASEKAPCSSLIVDSDAKLELALGAENRTP